MKSVQKILFLCLAFANSGCGGESSTVLVYPSMEPASPPVNVSGANLYSECDQPGTITDGTLDSLECKIVDADKVPILLATYPLTLESVELQTSTENQALTATLVERDSTGVIVIKDLKVDWFRSSFKIITHVTIQGVAKDFEFTLSSSVLP